MYSSVALVALWGALTPQIGELSLRWQQDYRQARTVGARDQRPLAVFVGRGADGWKQLVKEGTLDAVTRKTLGQRYVPVYINRETEDGRQLAELFGLANNGGLVISDRSGGVMAFRHEGGLPAAELARQLDRFADPGLVVNTTEGNGARPAPVYVAPQPVYVAPATFQNPYANPFACPT